MKHLYAWIHQSESIIYINHMYDDRMFKVAEVEVMQLNCLKSLYQYLDE